MASTKQAGAGGSTMWRYARYLVVLVLVPYVLVALPMCERAAVDISERAGDPNRATFASTLFLIIGGLILLGVAWVAWQRVWGPKLHEARGEATFDVDADLDSCKKRLSGLTPLAVGLLDNLHADARAAAVATLLDLERQGIIRLGDEGLEVLPGKHVAPDGKKTVAKRRTSMEQRIAARRPADVDPLDDVLTPAELYLVRKLEQGPLDEDQTEEWLILAEGDALATPMLKAATQRVGGDPWRGGWLQNVIILGLGAVLVIMTVSSPASQEAFAAARADGLGLGLSVLTLFASSASNMRTLFLLSLILPIFLWIMRGVLLAKAERDAEGPGASTTCMRSRRGTAALPLLDGLKGCLRSYEGLSDEQRDKLASWEELPAISYMLTGDSPATADLIERAGLSSAWPDVLGM